MFPGFQVSEVSIVREFLDNESSWWLAYIFEKYARQNGFIFPNFRGEH